MGSKEIFPKYHLVLAVGRILILLQSLQVGRIFKVHIFWEDHKNLKKNYQVYFWRYKVHNNNVKYDFVAFLEYINFHIE